MTKEHEQYKVLCGLAAAGEIPSDDMEDLTGHLEDCEECRLLLSDFVQVSAQAFPLLAGYRTDALPPDMKARFIERARFEGIPLRSSQSVLTSVSSFFGVRPRLAWIGIVTTGLVIWLAGSHFGGAHRVPPPQVSYDHSAAVPEAVTPSATQIGQAENVALELEIASHLKAQLANEQNRTRALSMQIAQVVHDNVTVRQQNDNLMAKLTALQGELGAQADAKKRLDEMRSAEADHIAALAEREDQIEKLRAELSERNQELKRDRELLSASSQARDLIVARNLHIVDVHDSNGTGKRQRPFGRIFYSEGKSLVFYAYDLEGAAKGDAKLAFHVWGTRLGEQAKLRSLGILRTEDSGAGRWVLTCDDPKVLSIINTVFVTAESAHKDIDQPSGKRILYAFLDGRANHP